MLLSRKDDWSCEDELVAWMNSLHKSHLKITTSILELTRTFIVDLRPVKGRQVVRVRRGWHVSI